MSHNPEKRPRQYASEIVVLSPKKARQDALALVPEHLQELTRKHVEIAFDRNQREQHGH